jgi:hypothetical protein
MSFSTEVCDAEYSGNNSTSTPYQIPFPFLTGSIRVSVTAEVDIGLIDDETPGAGFTDYLVTLNEGTDPEDDVPSVSDVVSDENDNEGVILAITNNGDGTFVMRISDQDPFNPDDGTALTHHQVDDLNSNEYTLTALADNAGGSFTTDVAVAVSKRVRVYRDTTMNQQVDIQPAGPFPATEVERALDKAIMLIQELSARISRLEGNNRHAVVVPAGVSIYSMALPFDDDDARGEALPTFIGQVGLQLDTGILYRATSIAAGQWSAVRHIERDYYRVLAYNTAVGVLSDRHVGTVPEDGTLIAVVVAVAEPGTVETEIDIVIGATSLPTAVLPEGDTSIEVTASGSFTAGQQINVTTSGDYGTPDATGLEIFLVYRR